MLVVHRWKFCSAKRHWCRGISSLCDGNLLRGAQWDYRILNAVTGDSTHASAVFKAEIILHENPSPDLTIPKWAIIKKSLSEDEIATENLARECQAYGLPAVASATCFRSLYDVIDRHTIALEWLDTTLSSIAYCPSMRIYNIMRAVLKSALLSCDALTKHQHVNTDYKPANILLSGIDSGCPVAKIGDLGLVVPSGHLFNAQPYAMRAPEVFLGRSCTAPSQVWAIAAMLLCWIKPGVLGAHDSPHPFINEAWCMAKLKRLFPHWHIPAPDEVARPTLQSAVEYAMIFSEEGPIPRAICPLAEELRKVDMPEQLRGLFQFMLVVDPDTRPEASKILNSEEFHALDDI